MQSKILPHAIFQIMEQLSTFLNLDYDIVKQKYRLNKPPIPPNSVHTE